MTIQQIKQKLSDLFDCHRSSRRLSSTDQKVQSVNVQQRHSPPQAVHSRVEEIIQQEESKFEHFNRHYVFEPRNPFDNK